MVIVAAMGIGGMILQRDLKRRRNELEQFFLGVRGVEREMSYAASSLWLCFERAGKGLNGEMRCVFLRTSELLQESADGEESFLQALAESRDRLALTDGDLEWMRRFGLRLGVMDMEHAQKDLCYIEELVSSALHDAERNEKKWGRVFFSGGWLFGFAAALVFI